MSKELADSLPSNPVDQYVITYWSTYNGLLCHVQMTYHSRTKWVDHPWADLYSDRRGADFEDEWSIETAYDQADFSPTARATGWDIRERLHQSHNHKTKAQAAKCLYDRAANKISNLKTDIAALEQAQSELEKML